MLENAQIFDLSHFRHIHPKQSDIVFVRELSAVQMLNTLVNSTNSCANLGIYQRVQRDKAGNVAKTVIANLIGADYLLLG